MFFYKLFLNIESFKIDVKVGSRHLPIIAQRQCFNSINIWSMFSKRDHVIKCDLALSLQGALANEAKIK
jgi:hypothetical protein